MSKLSRRDFLGVTGGVLSGLLAWKLFGDLEPAAALAEPQTEIYLPLVYNELDNTITGDPMVVIITSDTGLISLDYGATFDKITPRNADAYSAFVGVDVRNYFYHEWEQG